MEMLLGRKRNKAPQVALVYDWVVKWGGAERILLALHDLFPSAPLFTSVSRRQLEWANQFTVQSSFLNRLPGAVRHYRWLAGGMPLAFENLDFRPFDVVISVSSWAAKGIITTPQTFHLNYCLTPTRFLWSGKEIYAHQPGFGLVSGLVRAGKKIANGYLSSWDVTASARPDAMFAISKTVAERVKKFYHRRAEVVYPPVETDLFQPPKQPVKRDGWLVVSRLEPYKKVDMVVRVFNRLGWPLTVVGTGSQEKVLRRLAGPSVSLVGCVPDEKLVSYYYSCQGVVCSQEEDFGLVAVEAQSCGRPVVAFKRGGFSETVIPKTGTFFSSQTDEALYKTLIRFRPEQYSVRACRTNALRFSRERFLFDFKKKVGEAWTEFLTGS